MGARGEVSQGETSGPQPGEWGGGDVGEQQTGGQRRSRGDRWDREVWEVVAEGFEGHGCGSFFLGEGTMVEGVRFE